MQGLKSVRHVYSEEVIYIKSCTAPEIARIYFPSDAPTCLNGSVFKNVGDSLGAIH